MQSALRSLGIQQVDGILGDLGVSSHQFDTADRGFSLRFDAPLDMRMDQKQDLTAEKIINGYEYETLARLLREFGEVDKAGKIAVNYCFKADSPVLNCSLLNKWLRWKRAQILRTGFPGTAN